MSKRLFGRSTLEVTLRLGRKKLLWGALRKRSTNNKTYCLLTTYEVLGIELLIYYS